MSEITSAKENAQSTSTVKKITATAVMAALTTLMTAYIFHIPVGVNGGYVHLGDTMILSLQQHFCLCLMPVRREPSEEDWLTF